jgi:hypothetical protein
VGAAYLIDIRDEESKGVDIVGDEVPEVLVFSRNVDHKRV